MTDRYRRQVHSPPRFTALETRLMAALAHDLRQTVPDLAGQFQNARPGLRRNTAFGYYAETVVDLARPPAYPTPGSGPTGRFGTVHAMLSGLREAVSFQVELLNGRLLGLHADSYGQDTRAIDFATVPVTEIFTLDASGRSIPYQTAGSRHVDNLSHRLPPAAGAQPTPPRVVHVSPARAGETVAARKPPAPQSATPQAAPQRREPAPVAAPAPAEAPLDGASLKVGVWVTLGALAFLANLIFDVPAVAAAILVAFIGRAATSPKALPIIADALKSWRAQQKAPSGS
ncbi:hypothetical protein ACO2Q1_12350 [Brevundimonas sp. VNH65]|uniref:hypothetical protein n=1 Tax=Brevundimonas sp. VNH65 TaxID=3400917 RepID=UPI003BFE5341